LGRSSPALLGSPGFPAPEPDNRYGAHCAAARGWSDLALGFSGDNGDNGDIRRGVEVGGVDVGGMSKSEARKALEADSQRHMARPIALVIIDTNSGRDDAMALMPARGAEIFGDLARFGRQAPG
jgi:hypothetical protein